MWEKRNVVVTQHVEADKQGQYMTIWWEEGSESAFSEAEMAELT